MQAHATPSRPRVPHGGVNFVVEPGFEALLAAAGLHSAEDLFTTTQGESLSKPGLASWRERIRLTVNHDSQTQTLFLKRFTQPPASARREVRRAGNGAHSIAGVEWNWLHAFRKAGICCAHPVALAEEFVRGREARSAILMAAVPGKSLEFLARDGSLRRSTFHGLIAPTAELAAHMHALGCIHRDLYLAHLFADGLDPVIRQSTIDNRQLLVSLIDLQRVFRPTCCFHRWVVKDLAALYFSALDQLPKGLLTRTDALRWFKHYLPASRLDASAKQLAYRVLGRTQHLLRRHGQERHT